MPLTLNVGLNRKASVDYQSAGASINLTAELDQSLLTRPDELQRAAAELYDQASEALERQLNPSASGRPRPASNGHRHQNGNGRSTANDNGNGHHGATSSQRRAIAAIAKRLGLDAQAEARDQFDLDLDRMDVREASAFIDHLKALQASSNGHASRSGGRR